LAEVGAFQAFCNWRSDLGRRRRLLTDSMSACVRRQGTVMPISQVPTTVSPVVVPTPSPVPSVAAATPDTAARAAAQAAHTATVDNWTQAPSPPRFPWLSRESWQSEEVAARKRPVFDDAPVIGDQLNVSA